ncbi:MAG: TerB family tellurite resistance protein [Cyclobacteriaceae bacterium]
MNGIRNQLKALVQLAIVDEKFDKSEEIQILAIGKANGVPESEIREFIEAGLRAKNTEIKLDFSILGFDEKFEYLYNIIQLMKIDHEVFLSEIRYCEEVAVKLGFDKKVVSKMSSMIYSDPSITTNREKLKQKVKKFID